MCRIVRGYNLKTYNDLIDYFKDKKILFCGVGRSNLPFINMLTSENIKITAYDSKNSNQIESETLNRLRSNRLITLRLADETVWDENFDIAIRTPGMNFSNKNLQKLHQKGTAITSEMEMFFELCPCPIVGITGSDGKTTVTTIISEMLKQQGFKVHTGGNIGTPLLPKINEISKNDIAVVELSSFQLMSMRKSPNIAVITNISPNHLDVHKDMTEYIWAKSQIVFHQDAFSTAVLNYDNAETQKISEFARGKLLFFSSTQPLENGVWINECGDIIYSENGKNTKVLASKDIKIPGKHNLENYLAAIAAVYKLVNKSTIEHTAKNFSGVEHRIEFVRDLNGIKFYNDSIASSPTRVIKGALSLFENQKITLIAGGHDKKTPFDELGEKICEEVSCLILMGPASDKIKSAVLQAENYNSNKLKILTAKDMDEAVNLAYNQSKPQSVVLLSPACTSFDYYKNFEERGKHFKNIVNALK